MDEIGEIPVELQAKLLRVIENKSFYRVGGLSKVETDIRIIAATNLDLTERIEKGLFRSDLYYRLRVGSIMVPPLRVRTDGIVPLARLFLRSFAEKRGKSFTDISTEAAAVLIEHPWPGNVRELKNAMEWISVMHDAPVLLPEHLNGFFEGMEKSFSVRKSIPAAGKKGRTKKTRPSENDIDVALAATGGNKTKAAAQLGISIRMLYYRLAAREQSESGE